MEHEDAAKILSELGNTTRLAIFRYLVKVGPEGVPVGQVQKASRLMSVGLIKQDRASRTLYCTAQYAALRELIDFLQSECCVGITECN
jgi:DNA-binding transcriptional ArsR family regulator